MTFPCGAYFRRGSGRDWMQMRRPSQLSMQARFAARLHIAGVVVSALLLTWIGYNATAELVDISGSRFLPLAPAAVLEPFRIANQYGLFAVMTRGRYEIEFQGSNDGQNWTPYLFTHKPQAVNEAPGIYAPYQPRFDWNLWFASLGDWQQNDMVPITEERVARKRPRRDRALPQRSIRRQGAASRCARFCGSIGLRAWRRKRQTGDWWKRQFLGLYAPTLERSARRTFEMAAPPDELPEHD